MAEIDYQMALLLQYKFEQENNRKENTDSDHTLALQLQEQFKCELEVERPSNNLVYKASASSGSKCLVDPSWEVIDPTPDIHVLFITFNKRFFWDTLGSVTVAWSKRMTTCAGVCSYQGRGGMCSITLSEPLLKLRPRKDLVETLLHEMIHAYLFVTNNNRDRDGHGPEFHKHMYRINAEAGTNITVYHDFHDEVRLYQQHWWRCDGPCQQWKPYFGIVRRATNRVPGPNDRWWADHMSRCGGTFVKVKGPEKPDKAATKKKKEVLKEINPKNDIRNFITTSASNQSNKDNLKKPSPSSSMAKPTLTSNNVQTVSNVSGASPNVGNVISSKASNIFGFTNLGGPKKPGSSRVKGAVKNAGSSTFVVTKTATNTSDRVSDKPSTSTSDLQPFSGAGRSLSSSSISSSLDNRDYSVVRDHWLKKFGNNSQNQPQQKSVKRPSDSCFCPTSLKVPKLQNCDNNDVVSDDSVECPVCKKQFNSKYINKHLDSCLEAPCDDNKECIICGVKISIANFERHVIDCSAKNFSDDFNDEADLAASSENCEIPNSKNNNCPVCKKTLSQEEYGSHVQNCILGLCDEFDKQHDSTDHATKTPCLACGKDIWKSQLNAHLEECMSMSNVFDAIEDDADRIEEGGDGRSQTDNYNCPFCLKLLPQDEMQAHIDCCLRTENIVDDDDFVD